MDLDPTVTPIVAIIAGVIIGVLRYLDRRDRQRHQERLELHVMAAAERSRRRDQRERRRRELPARRRESVPEPFEDEVTDMHELVELEREARARRDTDRQERSRGDRPPRPGTHHDREE